MQKHRWKPITSKDANPADVFCRDCGIELRIDGIESALKYAEIYSYESCPGTGIPKPTTYKDIIDAALDNQVKRITESMDPSAVVSKEAIQNYNDTMDVLADCKTWIDQVCMFLSALTKPWENVDCIYYEAQTRCLEAGLEIHK